MLSYDPFPGHPPLPSCNLPLTLISLEEWALVTVSGTDTIKYLQKQLTCDVLSLGDKNFSFSGHCNAKGKMLSHLCVFQHGTDIAYIERYSLRDSQIAALKKYSIFSKITITANDEALLLGLAGFQAPAALSTLFSKIPDATHSVVHQQETTLLYYSLPTPRFLLITTLEQGKVLQKKLHGQVQFNDSRQWRALDIESGYPIIDLPNIEQFFPQETNLQALDAISFQKGCYIGQEMISRTKYHGTNKRALYLLKGNAKYLPTVGADLELKVGEHWRRTGKVLASCQLEDRKVWLQVVLNNKLISDSVLRVHNDSKSALFIHPLPYLIVE